MNNTRNRVRLIESQLRSVIKESVKQVLSELAWKPSVNAADKTRSESGDMDSPLYWKNQCLQMLKAIEQSINEDEWESIPDGIDFLQICYDYHKSTIRNMLDQNQQTAQQRTFGHNVDTRVQQQKQNNLSMQQQMANRTRQQVMNRQQNKFSGQAQ